MSSFPFHIKEHIVPGQHIREWPRATANSQEEVLNLHVKQYTPKDNPSPQPGDVTILAAHANGFPKELYEALWVDLHAQSQSEGGFRIRGIWIADVSHQGYSGELNEAKLGDDPAWHDHSRDLLHLTNVFRAEMPRPIIGIGHSFGANILTQLALMHPRLLTSLVLLDPTILDRASVVEKPGPVSATARLSTFRRDVWPSRQEAVEWFRRSPFYSSWDPRVLEAWNKHAIRDLPTFIHPEQPNSDTPSVTLRTTKHQEVFTFVRPLWPYIATTPPSTTSTGKPAYTVSKPDAPDYDPNEHRNEAEPKPFYRSESGTVHRSLPAVRPTVFFMHGSTSDISLPSFRAARLRTCGIGPGGSGGVKAGRVAEVVIEGRGHLFPMEVPAETAAHAVRWIRQEIARWRAEQEAYEAWTRLPARDKTTIGPAFIEKIGPRPERTPKAAEPKL
ncbi:Alpha/beta hydrolase family-domain-containing protein [Xylaria sp. CBS 124048]|nr:Alpha/beta hydrolase family-domain-containing protein [Xylaria sp. CBS 124048]